MDRDLQAPMILLVDDDPLMLDLLTHYLRMLAPHYPILTAQQAQGALEHLAQRSVALMIIDYLLPSMDGIQLTAAVKAIAPRTHVILISANDTDDLQRSAREQQVDTFLSKHNLFTGLGDILDRVLPPAVPSKAGVEQTPEDSK